MTRTTNLLTTLPFLFLLLAIGSEATALAADPLAAKALGQCKSTDCLRATIPSEKGKLLAASDCKVVEGRKDPDEVYLELGSVCRVLVARARAAFRAAAPCVSKGEIDIQPNWDPDLNKMYELDLQNFNHRRQESNQDASRSREGRHTSALGHGKLSRRHHRSMALPHGRIRAEEDGQVAVAAGTP
jgi:hypothetical protein